MTIHVSSEMTLILTDDAERRRMRYSVGRVFVLNAPHPSQTRQEAGGSFRTSTQTEIGAWRGGGD